MKQTILDLMAGKEDNHILPFFWQHGETEEVLRKYMSVINECGIGAVCIEARPHPDFLGPKWWKDMDVVLDEAKKRNMKVWILDDAHFPTGYAAGKLRNAEPELCKQYIMVNISEACGPIPEVTLDIAAMSKSTPNFNEKKGGAAALMGIAGESVRVFDDDKLLAVVASKLGTGNHIDDTLLDLTDKVHDGLLEWDVPEGMWRIFVLYNTRNGGGRTDYINMLERESCRVQIDAVYEPHWEHYKDEFGKTIAGFFSDEAAMGNIQGYAFNESIGRKMMPLPWGRKMPGMLEERLGKDYLRLLPALWCDAGNNELTAKIRYAYMDAATRLMKENFSDQIGSWCEEHGVEYIGHIVEENNQHSRLGCSMGHFFRAVHGQHMSGIDVIGNQVLPGGENYSRLGGFSIQADGEFYHYALGKLGSSAAHIDPKKKGRAMCEIYGAYGWNAGVRLMKYLTDHFLVRGINCYVPHAFSPKAFPDTDCPPHFYAHGYNPQYRHFGKLMRYLNRMCNLFNGGLHTAPVALLYHGEAEWTGGYMYMQKPAKQLLDNQIDFDIIPSDIFTEQEYYGVALKKEAGHTTLEVNKENYSAVVVPYAEFLTEATAKFIVDAKNEGLEVIFIDNCPSGICDGKSSQFEEEYIREFNRCTILHLEELAGYLQKKELADVVVNEKFPWLRYYHYIKGGVHAYMINNESMGRTFNDTISVSVKGTAVIYDAMENQLQEADVEEIDGKTNIRLTLEPYQSKVYIFGDMEGAKKVIPRQIGKKIALTGEWKLSLAESIEYPNFREEQVISSLHSIAKIYPDFSGFMRYEKEFVFDMEGAGNITLDIENAYEGVEVWINDVYAGMSICPPYLFDVAKLLQKGSNKIRIEVANTLFNKVDKMDIPKNPFGLPVIVREPVGIVGEVALYIN